MHSTLSWSRARRNASSSAFISVCLGDGVADISRALASISRSTDSSRHDARSMSYQIITSITTTVHIIRHVPKSDIKRHKTSVITTRIDQIECKSNKVSRDVTALARCAVSGARLPTRRPPTRPVAGRPARQQRYRPDDNRQQQQTTAIRRASNNFNCQLFENLLLQIGSIKIQL